MSKDYDLALPIRSEADGADERVQVKIVDHNDPSIGTRVDSDKNVHVEIHGDDEAGIDRVIITNEKGNIALDGDYDILDNTNPSSVGIIAHDRDAIHDRTKSNQRVTATPGEGNTVSLDVSIHDENGQNYTANNPVPVTIEESEGDEKHEFSVTEDIKKKNVATHSYTVPDGRILVLYKVLNSGSGKIKALLEIGDGAATEAFVPKGVRFNSVRRPDADFDLDVPLKIVGTTAGTTVRTILTNRESQKQDLYTTFIGIEKDAVI